MQFVASATDGTVLARKTPSYCKFNKPQNYECCTVGQAVAGIWSVVSSFVHSLREMDIE